jgi:hypothetical protein
MIDEKRLTFAKECIRLYGSKIPPEKQNDILAQRVTLGMTPYEARLAAGGGYYNVEADPQVWPPQADPELVMARQSVEPDNTRILMSFRTSTQYAEEGDASFSVLFERGRATRITGPIKESK